MTVEFARLEIFIPAAEGEKYCGRIFEAKPGIIGIEVEHLDNDGYGGGYVEIPYDELVRGLQHLKGFVQEEDCAT